MMQCQEIISDEDKLHLVHTLHYLHNLLPILLRDLENSSGFFIHKNLLLVYIDSFDLLVQKGLLIKPPLLLRAITSSKYLSNVNLLLSLIFLKVC